MHPSKEPRHFPPTGLEAHLHEKDLGIKMGDMMAGGGDLR